MPEVNVSELRNHLPEYLTRAETGEEILITRRGQVIARLAPFAGTRERAKQRLAKLRACARVDDVVSPIDTNWEVQR
jgi:prevent-host-death family protein